MPDAENGPVRWFLGTPFTPLALEDAASRIAERDPAAPFAYVTTPNAQHVVAAARGNAMFRAAQDEAWMSLNDSRILGLLADKLFRDPMPVAPGSDLTAHLFAHRVQPDDALTIVGGNDEVERRLRTMFGLSRIARHDPPMGFYRNPDDIARCVDFVRANPGRYVFLAVGAPQSETVARAIVAAGGATGIGLCIGSSLHFVTGVVRRAPPWVRKLYVESLWRLFLDPKRHFRRVFVESLPVLWLALRVKFSRARDAHVRGDRR